MTETPCDLKIEHISEPGQTPFIRITMRDKLTILANLDMAVPDFALACLGHEVLAAYNVPGAK